MRSLKTSFVPGVHLPRAVAWSLLIAYVAVVGASQYASLQPGTLGVRFGPCESGTCVSWVMPASHGWFYGARPGMAVLSVDGQRLTGLGAAEHQRATRAELVASTGEVITIKVIESPIIGRATKYSLWAVGGMFILLGAAVVTRRPDLASARAFGLFAAANALGLGVAPASGGPGTQWALIAQILALAGVGITFLPF